MTTWLIRIFFLYLPVLWLIFSTTMISDCQFRRLVSTSTQATQQFHSLTPSPYSQSDYSLETFRSTIHWYSITHLPWVVWFIDLSSWFGWCINRFINSLLQWILLFKVSLLLFIIIMPGRSLVLALFYLTHFLTFIPRYSLKSPFRSCQCSSSGNSRPLPCYPRLHPTMQHCQVVVDWLFCPFRGLSFKSKAIIIIMPGRSLIPAIFYLTHSLTFIPRYSSRIYQLLSCHFRLHPTKQHCQVVVDWLLCPFQQFNFTFMIIHRLVDSISLKSCYSHLLKLGFARRGKMLMQSYLP